MNIRALGNRDRSAVMMLYLDLSAEDRRHRFSAALSNAGIVNHVQGLDFAGQTLFGAFDARGILIGIAELHAGRDASEMAFAVRVDMRRRNIGTQLIRHLLRHARDAGMSKVRVTFDAENVPMRVLAQRAGLRIVARNGECNAARDLALATVQEMKEWLGSETANADYVSPAATSRKSRPPVSRTRAAKAA
jgi:GNAT superfamily N-acetyltransferase